MAGILIKGLEMPKEGSITITIRHDGAINFIGDMGSNLGRLVDCKAVALPEHGRLGDLDALGNKMANKMGKRKNTWHPFYYEGFKEALKMLDSAPTIVEVTE